MTPVDKNHCVFLVFKITAINPCFIDLYKVKHAGFKHNLNIIMKTAITLFALLLSVPFFSQTHSFNNPIVLAYFPSYSENWTTTNQNSKLREIPSFVNYVFLAFAKPNLTYTKDSFDISGTGIEVPYDGCTLKESVSALKQKGVHVILSIGGETYWNSNVYSAIDYQQIKDLVDDIGFVGIDWDFEPNGSFGEIGNATNIQHFINFFTNSRAIMPKSEGYILACAPAGVGALGGQTNNDVMSPFAYENRNIVTGETDANLYNGTVATNGINLFGFASTGHMIPVIEAVGDKIDIIAFQGYNTGGSTNRSIMYDAYAYYAEQYGFKVAAGVHYPNEPWGPYYTYTHQNVADLASHIRNYSTRIGDQGGIMLWQLLLANTGLNSSGYSYMNVANKVLNGIPVNTAISEANDYSLSSYTGGAEGCSGQGGTLFCGFSEYMSNQSYPTANTTVYYQCKIWANQWWANAGEIPGENSVWQEINDCHEGTGCTLDLQDFINQDIQIAVKETIIVFESQNQYINQLSIFDITGKEIFKLRNKTKRIEIDKAHLAKGIYIVKCEIEGKTLNSKFVLN